MLTIRLSRIGKRHAPQYRIVLQENHRDPWSPAIEVLGNYNPGASENAVTLKAERITYWLENGAQPSNTVHNMLVDAKLVKGEKVGTVSITKKRAKKLADEKAEEVKAQEEAAAKKIAEAEAAKAEAEAAKQAEADAKKAAAEAEEAAKAEATPATE